MLCGLRCRCRGWSAAAGPITSFLFTVPKTTGLAFKWANICGILTIHASQMSINLNRTGAFRCKKVNHHCLLSICVHNIPHFALLLCWTHVTQTGAPMTLVGLDSVAIRWVGDETLSDATFTRTVIGSMTFVPSFVETKRDGCLYSRTELESVLY